MSRVGPAAMCYLVSPTFIIKRPIGIPQVSLNINSSSVCIYTHTHKYNYNKFLLIVTIIIKFHLLREREREREFISIKFPYSLHKLLASFFILFLFKETQVTNY